MSALPVRGEPVALTDIAEAVRTEHAAAEADFQSAVGHAIRCGEHLTEAKAQIPHGSWGEWVGEHFPASMRTAQGYMRLADRAEDARRVAHLGVRGTLKQLAEPQGDGDTTPEAEPAVEQARWTVWRADWEWTTGEPAPGEPEGLWAWLATGPLALHLTEADPLDLHCHYVHVLAPPVHLRTGKTPPPPPSFEPDADHAMRHFRWRLDVERNCGRILLDFDRLGYGDGQEWRAKWTVNVAGARELLQEGAGDEWTDEDYINCARGHVACILSPPPPWEARNP